jgi:hypothetical protein
VPIRLFKLGVATMTSGLILADIIFVVGAGLPVFTRVRVLGPVLMTGTAAGGFLALCGYAMLRGTRCFADGGFNAQAARKIRAAILVVMICCVVAAVLSSVLLTITAHDDGLLTRGTLLFLLLPLATVVFAAVAGVVGRRLLRAQPMGPRTWSR